MFKTMFSYGLTTLLSVVALTAPLAAVAEEPYEAPDKISNAALVYWQAFSLLPVWSEENEEIMEAAEAESSPEKLLEMDLPTPEMAFELSCIRPETPCRWGIVERGPMTLLPHLGKARQLARLLVLNARLEFARGNSLAAIERISQVMLLARNIDEGVLVHLLVGIAIETQAMEVVESELENLDAAALKQWRDVFAALPPRATLARSIGYEQSVFLSGVHSLLEADDQKARTGLEILVDDANNELIARILGGKRSERTAWLDEMQSVYDEMIEVVKGDRRVAARKLTALEREIQQSTNPLIQHLMPSVSSVFEKYTKAIDKLERIEQKTLDRDTP